MKIQDSPATHLTYCLNIHPGESWAENFAAIRDKAVRVRNLVGPDGEFGLGLRLGNQAACELLDPARRKELKAFLADNALYVFTVNAFPYGQFHQTAVKEDVYAPDWRSPQRLQYTQAVANILADLLPAHVQGSISTAPGSYKSWIQSRQDEEAMVRNLVLACFTLFDIRHTTGKRIELAIEPEPDCYIEGTGELIDFLTGPLRDYGERFMDRQHQVGDEFRDGIWEHLGACLDTAHAAVLFEDPLESLRRLRQARIHVSKVQVSSALRLQPRGRAMEKLRTFAEGVYLHQVKARRPDGTITSYADLPQALAAASDGADDEWRVHFHVPLFFDSFEGLHSTSDLLTPSFFAEACQASRNLEIETYTFDVLPADLRPADVTDSIANEYRWVLKQMRA